MTKRADFKSVKSTFQNTPPNQVLELNSCNFETHFCSFECQLLPRELRVNMSFAVIDMFVLYVQREVCRLIPGPEQRDGVRAFLH